MHREIDDSVELLSPVKDGIRLLPPQVRALSDVNATNPGELSYKKGDIIDVELRSTADQWQGRLGSHTGTFRLDGSLVGNYVLPCVLFANRITKGTCYQRARACGVGLLAVHAGRLEIQSWRHHRGLRY